MANTKELNLTTISSTSPKATPDEKTSITAEVAAKSSTEKAPDKTTSVVNWFTTLQKDNEGKQLVFRVSKDIVLPATFLQEGSKGEGFVDLQVEDGRIFLNVTYEQTGRIEGNFSFV